MNLLNKYTYGSSTEGVIQPYGSISRSTLKIGGIAYSVTSDRSGYKKFYLYGNWQWLKPPFWTLTDKMSIGFPESSGLFLPTSSGKVTQFSSRYSYDRYGDGRWVDTTTNHTPNKWEPSAGVAAAYDIVGLADNTLHKGYVGQYVYVRNTVHKDINIKIEYGHKKVSGSVSIGVYPSGLAVTPTTNTDIASYALTLSY